MARKKGESTPINYAADLRSRAEKILKDFDSQERKTQNEPDDLIPLPTLLSLKKRLDELSSSTFAINRMFKEVEEHNCKAPAEYKVSIEGEIADSLKRAGAEVYNKARSIFNEAAGAGIELPSVPAGSGTALNFEKLQSWIDESLLIISSSGKAEDEKQSKKNLKPLSENVPIEYSLPLSLKKWAIIFNVSENTLRGLRKEKKYHFDQVSARKWRLPKHEIPTEYLEKYRQTTSQRTQ